MRIEKSVALYICQELTFDTIIEYKFHPTRKWLADIAVPDLKVLIEIHGGVWTSGRHLTGKGFLQDREKINAAQILGWKVLEYSTAQAKSMVKIISDLKEIIESLEIEIIESLEIEKQYNTTGRGDVVF